MRRSALLDCVPNALGHVVLRLEEPESPAAVGDVVDVIRKCLREPIHLADERRDEEEPEEREAGEHEDGRDPGCKPSAANAVVLEPVDGGVHREREEDRDQNPGENLARDPDELEHEKDPDRDPEQRKDRRGPKADNALLHCAGGLRPRRTFELAVGEAGGGDRTRATGLETQGSTTELRPRVLIA